MQTTYGTSRGTEDPSYNNPDVAWQSHSVQETVGVKHFPICKKMTKDKNGKEKRSKVFNFDKGEYGDDLKKLSKCNIDHPVFMKLRCDKMVIDGEEHTVEGMRTWCYEDKPTFGCCCHDLAHGENKTWTWTKYIEVQRHCWGPNGVDPYKAKLDEVRRTKSAGKPDPVLQNNGSSDGLAQVAELNQLPQVAERKEEVQHVEPDRAIGLAEVDADRQDRLIQEPSGGAMRSHRQDAFDHLALMVDAEGKFGEAK